VTLEPVTEGTTTLDSNYTPSLLHHHSEFLAILAHRFNNKELIIIKYNWEETLDQQIFQKSNSQIKIGIPKIDYSKLIKFK
jgi:hypothetical protein